MVSARRKPPSTEPAPNPREDFSPQTFEALAKDLQNGRLPLNKVTVTDSVATGLSVIIRPSGVISYHVHYRIGDSRPMMKIGVHDPKSPEHITVAQARNLARTVQTLAERGVDVQEGLHMRLVKELMAQGTKWRP